MPSIHKPKRSPFWHCAFYLPDGRRTLRSTRETSRRKALAVCLEFDKATRLARADNLSDTRAREVIADIYAIRQKEILPSATLETYAKVWLKRKELEVADASHKEYAKVVEQLLELCREKANRPMDALSMRDAVAFRDRLAARVSPATTNKYIKIARVLWRQAGKDGYSRDNVFARVDSLKVAKSMRRPFSLPELRAVLSKCDQEWRAMVLAGLYTGQRIGDVSSLTWRQVDFPQRTIHFTTQKTGRHINLPMAKPLESCLLDLPSSDDPEAPVFANAYNQTSNTLARQFSEILMEAGLAPKRNHGKHGKGRTARRELAALSFHCLRHTATSLLKNAGVSDVVAREIIGHDSEAVSRVYTHIESGTLREALDLLPDVNDAPKPKPPPLREKPMNQNESIKALERAVQVAGTKDLLTAPTASTLAKFKRAASGTTALQDKAALRAKQAKRK